MKDDPIRRSVSIFASKRERTIDDARRPVWLEATQSFYKKLNRIARKCQLTRYDALRLGLDALLRETEVRNSALNRNIRTRHNLKCSAEPWDRSHAIIGQRSVWRKSANAGNELRRRAGVGVKL
jgi:hypothetical protein